MRTIALRSILWTTITLVSATGGLRTIDAAQLELDVVPAPNNGQPVEPAEFLVFEFNQAALGESGPDAAEHVQQRLEHILAKRIDAIDRLYRLSQVQKQKLRLAGRGDIRRFTERIDALRQKFVAARRQRAAEVAGAALVKAEALNATLKSGPFSEGSLFAKASHTILSQDQLEKSEERRRLAGQSKVKITLDNARILETAGRFEKYGYRLGFTGNENEVAVLPFGMPLEICSRDKLEPLRTIGEGHKLVGFDFSRLNIVALATDSTTALLVDLATGKETALETKLRQPAVSFSPDGKLLATGGYGMRALLWSAESGKRIRELPVGSTEGGLMPAFSPDGTIVAVSNRNSKTCLFDVATGRLLRRLSWQSSHELKFDPSGKRLAVAYADGNLAIWDVATGELLQRARGHAEEVFSLDWSPDGKIVASGGREGSVTLWRAANLTPLIDIEAPEQVFCVRFNPAGTRLLFGGSKSLGGRYIEILGVPQE